LLFSVLRNPAHFTLAPKDAIPMDVKLTTRAEPNVTPDLFRSDEPLDIQIQELLSFIAGKTPLVEAHALDDMIIHFQSATELHRKHRALAWEVVELRNQVADAR
jgi:hypothetical protein